MIKVCSGCGNKFESTVYNKAYCSKKCHYDNFVSIKYSCVCGFCKTEFKCSTKSQKYCSISCHRKSLHSQLYFDGKKRCASCKKMISISNYGMRPAGKGEKKINSHCNDCWKSINNARMYKRRAWSATIQKIDIIQVFDSFGWKCNKCGANTPKELRGTYLPNSPELDHIIPLSKGGDHVIKNVQLLCRSCNLKKSNKWPDQNMNHCRI